MSFNNLLDRITIDVDVCHGKPVVRGMRYPVDMVLDLLGAGMTMDEILNDYNLLVKEDILACLQYASQVTKIKSIKKIVA